MICLQVFLPLCPLMTLESRRTRLRGLFCCVVSLFCCCCCCCCCCCRHRRLFVCLLLFFQVTCVVGAERGGGTGEFIFASAKRDLFLSLFVPRSRLVPANFPTSCPFSEWHAGYFFMLLLAILTTVNVVLSVILQLKCMPWLSKTKRRNMLAFFTRRVKYR